MSQERIDAILCLKKEYPAILEKAYSGAFLVELWGSFFASNKHLDDSRLAKIQKRWRLLFKALLWPFVLSVVLFLGLFVSLVLSQQSVAKGGFGNPHLYIHGFQSAFWDNDKGPFFMAKRSRAACVVGLWHAGVCLSILRLVR